MTAPKVRSARPRKPNGWVRYVVAPFVATHDEWLEREARATFTPTQVAFAGRRYKLATWEPANRWAGLHQKRAIVTHYRRSDTDPWIATGKAVPPTARVRRQTDYSVRTTGGGSNP